MVTYVPTCEQVAVAERSWNGAYCRSQVAELQTPLVLAPPVMMAWPFLFCQKPIVSAPVCAGPQIVTVCDADPVVAVVLVLKVAVFVWATQSNCGTG